MHILYIPSSKLAVHISILRLFILEQAMSSSLLKFHLQMRRKERFASISEQAAEYSELFVLSSLLTSYATFDIIFVFLFFNNYIKLPVLMVSKIFVMGILVFHNFIIRKDFSEAFL